MVASLPMVVLTNLTRYDQIIQIMNHRFLSLRYCKLLLSALLMWVAGSVYAVDYSPGFFSVGPDRYVHFATTNYTEPGTGREYFQWSEIAAIEAAGYEVLTNDEWTYLYDTRPHAYELFALATVKGEQGLVILPDYDTWVLPAGCSFNYYDTGDGYGKNIYDAAKWSLMEAAGAIFLPARGYSDGTTTYDAGTHGSYWVNTEDEYNAAKAYRIQFDDQYFIDKQTMEKTRYYSIRTLHQEPAIILNENDDNTTFATKLASARALTPTEAYIIRTLAKEGYFYTLTLPFNVPDIDASPLAGAEVYTFASAVVENETNLIVDVTPAGKSLSHGTPYFIQWPKTGEQFKLMHFSDIEWDNDTYASDVVRDDVTFRGFYPKTHIDDTMDGNTHLYLFLGPDNTLYWPAEGDATSMKGFRGYFRITPGGGGGAHAPIRRGMSTSLRIRATATGVENDNKTIGERTKVLENGHLVIIVNGKKYSLIGQPL